MTNYPLAGRYTVSPDGTMLAFGTYLDDIRIVAIGDTAAPKPIAIGIEPAWSPDSRHLAFRTNGGIAVMEAAPPYDTRIVVQGDDLTDPSWSPDGKQLAFTRNSSEGYGSGVLEIVRTDGTGLRQLTWPLPDQTMYDVGSVWSPDGRFIAFQRHALCPEEPSRGCIDIVIVPTQGGDVRVLTAAAPVLGPGYYKRISSRPTW